MSKAAGNPNVSAERLIMLLGDLMEKMVALEATPMDFGTGATLHRAEIHTVQGIGKQPGSNLTRLASALGVTKGAVSQMVSKLVRKGLVRKKPAAGSSREIELDLTALGRKAFDAHEQLHRQMGEVVRKYYGAANGARLKRAIEVAEEFNALVGMYTRAHD